MFETIGKSEGPPVVICGGRGGVGKTTLSAAIALRGAFAGQRTVLLGVDPDRRLAELLWEDGGKAGPPKAGPFKATLPGAGAPKGELHVMPVDAKRVFDGMIERHASGDARQRMLSNRYYRHLSENMPGTQEYMALEALCQARMQGEWDLIVLDAPFARGAIDFLDAPERILDLLGHPYFMKLLKPGSRGGKLGGMMFGFIANPVHKAVSQVIGREALDELVEFFSLFHAFLLDGFQKRAKTIQALLASPATAFVAITTPLPGPVREAVAFKNHLRQRGMRFHGFIVNRVHRLDNLPDPAAPPEPHGVSGLAAPEIADSLETAYERYYGLMKQDEKWVHRLREETGPGAGLVVVPLADSDIADMEGLIRILPCLGG